MRLGCFPCPPSLAKLWSTRIQKQTFILLEVGRPITPSGIGDEWRKQNYYSIVVEYRIDIREQSFFRHSSLKKI
ncbi:hypothetical protein HI914_01217 [Erysiphe necator]|nr:hypothetical protein HI914_01217 [Erysiphe necator]